jgi:hypothetical protein
MTLPAEIAPRIESWRERLARDIARRNPALTSRQLHYVVQITIERLLFLRMCEERGLEPHGRLMGLLDGSNIYRRLVAIFRQAEDRYGSGLFHFRPEKGGPEGPDALTPGLVLDDESLRDILRSLHDREDSDAFSVLPAEVLGQVYEQSLGKVITLSADRRVCVEDKSKVKKAGGVFYTPAPIVDYLVRQTVGQLLEGCTVLSCKARLPKLDRPLHVLDPACGCGSFLLGAYQQLLGWHLAYYEQHDPKTWAAARVPPIYLAGTRGWQLTCAERKRILRDHIYGVDLDARAVDVTKLSLLLKALEGGEDLRLVRHRRAWPDLAGAIKCGNALIGPDFYQGRQPAGIDDEERRRINAFDWQAEFPRVFHDGGFDAVIGNPPWGQKEIDLGDRARAYLRKKYVSLAGIMDAFRPFVEKGIRLLAPGGRYGMVLPDVVLLKDYPDTRLFMLENLCLHDIRWWGMAFDHAIIDAVTIVARKERASDGQLVHVRIEDPAHPLEHQIPQSDFLANPRYTFNLHLTAEKRAILRTLEALPRLGDFFEIHEGVHSGNMRAELFVDSALDSTCKPLYFGRDEIVPYSLRWQGRYVRLGAVAGDVYENPVRRGMGWESRNHRQDAEVTKPHGQDARATSHTRFDTWNGTQYANLGRRQWHERPKVLVRRTGDHVMAAVEEEGFYASNNFFLVFPSRDSGLDLHGLCALLNSRFMTWYFRCIEPRRGRAFAELKIKHLRVFPLPRAVCEANACHELNTLGRERTVETRRLADSLTPAESEAHGRSLRRTDERIEEWVLSSIGYPSLCPPLFAGVIDRQVELLRAVQRK